MITAEDRRDRNHWKPLESLIGKRAAEFMFMDCIMHAGKRLYLYKHGDEQGRVTLITKGEGRP